MPLPSNFSEWEHLQGQISRLHNRMVRDWFNDAPDDDISTPRGSLKRACLIQDNDTIPLVQLRLWLFEVTFNHAKAFHPPLYTIPSMAYQDECKFKPQVSLYFLEDLNDVEPGYNPVSGEISIRLMNKTSENITMTEVQAYANRIKTAFAGTSSFVWRKGKVMCTYTDTERGYRLQLLCRDKAEGRRVIEQVLDIQQHAPDWKNMNVNENEEASSRYPTLPPTERILGKTVRLPRRRPIAEVRFQYAVLHVWGNGNPIVLVDRSGNYRNPIAS